MKKEYDYYEHVNTKSLYRYNYNLKQIEYYTTGYWIRSNRTDYIGYSKFLNLLPLKTEDLFLKLL